MDEARKNFLYNQIISGLKFLTIEGVRYKLSPPSRERPDSCRACLSRSDKLSSI